MKRKCAFALVAVLIFMLAGCSAPQSADVGKEIEQFGFVFTIPQGVTGNEIDDGIYDIDFGVTGKREAFIGINPPEDMTGKGDGGDLLQLVLDDMHKSVSGYFDNISNEVVEIRTLDGNPAGYIGLDCTISDLPIHWQIYMVVLDNTLYSFTMQVYTDRVTRDTLAAINQFVEDIQVVGTSA